MPTADQAQKFVDERLRPQATRARAFLAMAAADADSWRLEYQAYFAPGSDPSQSAFVDTRTGVAHNVDAAKVTAFMLLLARVSAVITQADSDLLEQMCPNPLTAS
jgi:hypothetical protein